jgi:hypothetical protein
MSIRWPKEWDSSEGWPDVKSPQPASGCDSRTWGTMTTVLHRKYGRRLATQIEALGGPRGLVLCRDLEAIRKEIYSHFKTQGVRPTTQSGDDWWAIEGWLRRRHSTTLAKMCDEMGLPSRLNLKRSIQTAEQAVKGFFAAHQRRPVQEDGPEWRNWQGWLYRQGSSLFKICEALGLPGGRTFVRTIDGVKAEVRSHFACYGRRPSEKDPVWRNHAGWLRKQGSSLRQVCDDLCLPGGLQLNRTVASVQNDILRFHKRTGHWPTLGAGHEWQRINDWLRHNCRSSLKQLVESLIEKAAA